MRHHSIAAGLIITLALCLVLPFAGKAQTNDNHSTDTRTAVLNLMKSRVPRLSADTTMTANELSAWREASAEAMKRLMHHPDKEAAQAKKIGEAARDGYRIERWQSYPLEGSAVNFYVLIPNGVDEQNPSRGGVLCIPGFGQTKELLAGERTGNFTLEGEPDSVLRQAAMARHFVDKGLVAVAVDNPSFGELNDNGVNDFLNTSRILLEQDWNYLGLTSWQDKVILDWLKEQPYVNRDRIIVSGFSLGTEPLMVLGLLDNDIYAFVYNDFLCRTRERIFVMDRPDENGNRPFPNSIEHLIPGFLLEFDFPDLVAALSPRPVICTEGGLDRDFRLIGKIYEKAGAPEAFEYHHYAKYVDPDSRAMKTDADLPGNLDRNEFFRLANVDSPNHYFKSEHIMPWLDKIMSDN